MRKILAALALAPLLSACSSPMFGGDERPVAATPDPQTVETTTLPGTGAGADDQGNLPPPPTADAGGLLGETLAGLGATGGPGNWLSTGLVTAAQPGRVETASGGSLSLELRPSGAAPSAGSTISLQAMQALGLPLGQLATLKVYTE